MRIAEIVNNKVVRVVISEDEEIDSVWLSDNLGGTWIAETDKGIPNIGYSYNKSKNAFIPPKPIEGEWILNEETCLWEEVIDE